MRPRSRAVATSPIIVNTNTGPDMTRVLNVHNRLPSRAVKYGGVAIAFHWIAFALIVFLGTLGLLFGELPRTTQPFWINVHGTVGLVYFALVVARVAWRLGHRPPDFAPGCRRAL